LSPTSSPNRSEVRSHLRSTKHTARVFHSQTHRLSSLPERRMPPSSLHESALTHLALVHPDAERDNVNVALSSDNEEEKEHKNEGKARVRRGSTTTASSMPCTPFRSVPLPPLPRPPSPLPPSLPYFTHPLCPSPSGPSSCTWSNRAHASANTSRAECGRRPPRREERRGVRVCFLVILMPCCVSSIADGVSVG
jgi:hypothetical protein